MLKIFPYYAAWYYAQFFHVAMYYAQDYTGIIGWSLTTSSGEDEEPMDSSFK